MLNSCQVFLFRSFLPSAKEKILDKKNTEQRSVKKKIGNEVF